MQLRHLEMFLNVITILAIFSQAKLNKLDIFNNIDVHSLFTLNVSNCNCKKQLVISSFYLGKVFSNDLIAAVKSSIV